MRHLILSLAILTTATHAVGQELPLGAMAQYHDEAIRNATECGKLVNLREVHNTEKELRIWVYGELSSPCDLYRFTEDGGAVTGEAFAWWSRSRRRDVRGLPSMVKRADSGWGCDDVNKCGATGICRRTFPSPIDWNALYRTLVSRQVWDLPDETELPDLPWTAMDGVTLIVEVRQGSQYRRYAYRDHLSEKSGELAAINAQQILEALTQAERKSKGLPPG